MENKIRTKANLKCPKCGEMLKPKEDDCCVFCSYADSKCPPKQLE